LSEPKNVDRHVTLDDLNKAAKSGLGLSVADYYDRSDPIKFAGSPDF
jgi:hypothetical protein